MKQKKLLDEEKEAREQAATTGIGDDEENQAAALKLQKLYRGRRARKRTARIARHFVSLATPIGLFVPADSIEKWFA